MEIEDLNTFGTLGHCYRCGDTNGPWTLMADGWLCDNCIQSLYGEEKDGKSRHKFRKTRKSRTDKRMRHNFD